jgi:hypothetical protein
MKGFYSKIKELDKQPLYTLSDFLIKFLAKFDGDEKYCKVLQYSLMLIYRINKRRDDFYDGDLKQVLETII